MKRYVIGIDEVGRGCLAGPVAVVALGFREGERFDEAPEVLRDSKKMTSGQRLRLAEFIKQEAVKGKLFFAVTLVYPARIDKFNISKAANEAAYRSLKKVLAGIDRSGAIAVTLDGGLYLKTKKIQDGSARRLGVSAKTVIKADDAYREVMMASVVAKVFRDLKMIRIHRKFPTYGFSNHKGYGTGAHIKAIITFGQIPGIHRKSFLGGILNDGLG